MKTVTACTLDCHDACSLVVDTDGNGNVRVRGNPDHPFTRGFTCARIRRYPRRLAAASRITRPLLRDGSGWRAIEWRQALDICAERIQALRRQPETILHIPGAGDMGVLKNVGALLFGRLGAARVTGSLCCEAGTAAMRTDFGAVEQNGIASLARARRIVLWGRDVVRCSVHTARLVRQARRRGAPVVRITAGGDLDAGLADEVIPVRPGTDRFLAAAVMRHMLDGDSVAPGALDRAANGGAFCDLLRSRPPEVLAAACGVDETAVRRLHDFYTTGVPVATLIGWGLQRYDFGAQNVRYINALAVLAGHIGLPDGGNYYYISPLRNFNLQWATPPDGHCRTLRKPTIGADLLSARPPVRFVWINGTNLVSQSPDADACARALRAVDTTVVVDAFMTDTARCADLILPPTLVLEKEDLVGSYLHDYIQYCRPALAAPGQARPDDWIFRRLAMRLDPPVVLPDAQDCLRASLDSPWLDIDLEMMRKRGWARAKRPETVFNGGVYAHAGGCCRLPERLDEEPAAPEGYPLRLLTLIRRSAQHSQLLEGETGTAVVQVAAQSLDACSVDPERPVWLVSPLGRMRVSVRVANDLLPGVVVGRRGGWVGKGCGFNRLISAACTDMGENAPYYRQYVRLEN